MNNEKNNNKEFSAILTEILREYGLTQTAFAAKIGVKQSQISEWLKGKAKPGYDNLRAMVSTFDISAEYLLGLTEL